MSVRKSLAISTIEKNIYTILNLVMMVSISRLLSPDEIGIHVIGSSIALLAAELKSFGMGGYLVREKELTTSKIRSTFTVSMLIAFLLGTLLIVSATVVADFYNDQRLIPVLFLFSIGFFISPFSVVTSAVLTRNFQFGKLSITRLSEAVIAASFTLLLIFLDFGYLSLAIGTAIGNITAAILFLYFRPKIVSYLPSFTNLKTTMRSGFFTSFAAILTRGAVASPELIIGKIAGINDAALFSRAAGFIKFSKSIVFSMIKPVIAPYLSKSNREGTSLSSSYIRVNLLVGGICWPILAVAGVFAEQAIIVMFGDQWVSSAPMASTLAIWALLNMLFVNFQQLLLTISKENINFYLQIIMTTCTIFICIFAGLINTTYVPLALVISALLRTILQAILFKKFFSINILNYLWELKKSFAVTAACFALALGLRHLITASNLSIVVSTLVLIVTMPVIWLICIAMFKHPFYSEVKGVANKFVKYKRNT